MRTASNNDKWMNANPAAAGVLGGLRVSAARAKSFSWRFFPMPAMVLSEVLRKRMRVLRLSMAAVVCLLVCAASASAATYTVTSTGDTEDPGTLRWAIEQLEPGDTINFAVTGTITLTRHLPALLNTVTVTGPVGLVR